MVRQTTRIYLLFSLGIFLLSFGNLMAQNQITGKVINHEKEAVIYANVLIYSTADSSLVKFTTTGDDGSFRLEDIGTGNYELSIHSIGLEEYRSDQFQLGTDVNTLDLGTIKMASTTTNLSEVVVTHKIPLVKIEADKIVLNVENTINATGTNAAQILKRAPGLRIDANGEILVEGRKGVQVYIDGQLVNVGGENGLGALEGLRSSDIKSIEVISNPSAKYDAAGNGGVINVVLKKSTLRGFNNTINTTLIYGFTPKIYAGYDFNYRKNKWNLFGNIGYYTGKSEGRQETTRQQLNNDLLTTYDQISISTVTDSNINFKVGTDWYLSEKNTIGFFVKGNRSTAPVLTENEANIFLDPMSIDSTLSAQNIQNRNINRTNYNFNYQFAGNGAAGKKLNLLVDYFDFYRTETSVQPNIYAKPNGEVLTRKEFGSNSLTNIDLFSAKLDYEQKAFGGQLSTGIKASKVNSKNDFEFFNKQEDKELVDENRSRFYSYKEDIYAAYLNYNLGYQRFFFNLGLRGEYTDGEGELIPREGDSQIFLNDYFNFFPSVLAGYNFNENSDVKIGYNRRVDRPSYENLNPFVISIDELTFSAGNPFLRPQFSDNFQLSYRYKNTYTSLNYSKTANYIAQVLETIDELRSFQTYKNIADVDVWSLSISTGLDITKNWNTRFNVNMLYSGYKGELNDEFLDVNNFAVGFNNEQNFKFGKDWNVQLFGYFNGPKVDGTFEMKSMWSVDAAISKKILNGAGSLRLALTDVFKSWENRAVVDYGGVYLNGRITWESRQIKLSFNYRFGNNKLRDPKHEKSASEEEQQRIIN